MIQPIVDSFLGPDGLEPKPPRPNFEPVQSSPISITRLEMLVVAFFIYVNPNFSWENDLNMLDAGAFPCSFRAT